MDKYTWSGIIPISPNTGFVIFFFVNVLRVEQASYSCFNF